MPDIFDTISVVIAALYVLLMNQLFIGWLSLKYFNLPAKAEFSVKLSVIIPARNEEENIGNCLSAILHQDYPARLFEIIVVDDNSTDNTCSIIRDFINKFPGFSIKLLQLSNYTISSSFKKNAITHAVKEASGELIITTDADCTMNPKWLSCIAAFYSMKRPAFISAPVCFSEENTFFKKLQSIEFLSLVYSGASSISLGFPVMCNGANLAFEKKVFEEISGYDADIKFASGDDVFLMLKIKKRYPQRIAFLKSWDAMVSTKACQNINSFFQQRKRWVSKSSGYKTFAPIFVASVIFAYNSLLLILPLFAFFFRDLWTTVAALLIIKFIIDFPAIVGSLWFVKKLRLIWLYFPMQVIYPIYITFIGIIGNISSYKWKGRIEH